MSRNRYKYEKKVYFNVFKTAITGFMGAIIIIILFLGLGEMLLKGYRFVTTTDIFQLKKIEIQGIKYLRKEYIKNLLNIKLGNNIFDINLIELKNQLIQNKWITDITIKRIIPDKIVINIKENEPIFILKKNSQLFYIDKFGRIIAPVTKDIVIDIPIVENNNNDDVKKIVKAVLNYKFPIVESNIGWISSTSYYLKFYDYKNDVIWYVDWNNYKQGVENGKKVWSDLLKRREIDRVREIRVIGNLVWVGF